MKSLVLVACVLVSAASIGYATAGPVEARPYTGFAVLSPDGDRLVADDYPTVGAGNGTVVAAVMNHERRRMDYTVVATAQRVELSNDGTRATVVERAELGRVGLTVPRDGTGHVRFDVTDISIDGQVRVVFTLYRGSAPDRPERTTAYRDLHVWVNGTVGADSDAG